MSKVHGRSPSVNGTVRAIGKNGQCLRFGNGNAKLDPAIFTFSIPAGWTCRYARACKSKSDRDTGHIIDGPHTEYRCYAASTESRHSNVRQSRFFANRTKESELTHDERSRLAGLQAKCKDTWAAAPCFDAFIRQSVEIRKTEDERRPLGPGDELYPAFVSLADEVIGRLPTFCSPADSPATEVLR